jgi:hypothetical protein
MVNYPHIHFDDILELLPSCVCAVLFLILLLWDVYKALKRRALWTPGVALVLSALTIQMLGLIDFWDIRYKDQKQDKNKEAADLLREDQLVIDCRRLMICVFIGYLLPGMVRSGWFRVWSDIGGLVLAVLLHMLFELYFVWKFIPGPSKQSESFWFFVSGTTLFTSTVLLLLLLSCAVLAGKTIRKLISLKVPVALSCCNSPEKRVCDNIGDHVLKCWIVVRASQPDYVMARSVFSPLAGLVVTVSVVIFVVKWICIHLPRRDYDIVHRITVGIEFAFVLVGWIVILFRWLTAVIYFPRNPYSLFYLEDFWTRSLVELKEDLDRHLKGRGRLYRLKRIRQRTFGQSVMVNFLTGIRLHSLLLPMRIWLQKFMVALGKACWSLSEIVIGWIRPLIMTPGSYALLYGLPIFPQETDRFAIFKDALDCLRMPGEIAYSLWIANQWAFQKAENHMNQGIEKGKNNTSDLRKILTDKTWSAEGNSTALAVDVEKYYQELGKKSWKMRAVSLMYCMIHVSEYCTNSDVINDAINVYCQAWDFMDFVDSSDPEANLVSLAADRGFDTLQHIWNKKSEPLLERKIGPLIEGTAPSVLMHDSEEWMTAAMKLNLHKTCRAVDVHSVNAISDLRCLWTNVIVHCIKNELDKALIENCSKWAEHGQEEEIYRAAFVAGKVKGMRQKMGCCNDQDYSHTYDL